MSDTTHADDTTSTRLRDETHSRVKAHCRDGETLSGCIGRALDALEREEQLPDAVREVMGADE